jgi:hypothetical protein
MVFPRVDIKNGHGFSGADIHGFSGANIHFFSNVLELETSRDRAPAFLGDTDTQGGDLLGCHNGYSCCCCCCSNSRNRARSHQSKAYFVLQVVN